MPSIIISAILIAFTLTFIIRPLSVFLIALPFRASPHQSALISFSGLRGATSIVFAILATVSDAYTKNDIFHIVFCVVLLSIGIQGTLLPIVAQKLNMIDDDENVLKTFTDYSNETEIQFIKLSIDENHLWKNQKISDINLPPETLIVMISRNGKTVVPRGNTVIIENDILVLSALKFETNRNRNEQILLSEEEITECHEWAGHTVAEIMPKNVLAVMIKRNGKSIIPKGDSEILCGDIVVIHTSDEDVITQEQCIQK
jgi:cell volume regulation protein A